MKKPKKRKSKNTAIKLKKLEIELKEAKNELEIQTWGLEKTNKAIKLLYKELEARNKRLRELDKLKSDFISTVSHELRTPLSIVKEGINLVMDEIPGEINEKQKKVLTASKDNIDRLTRIINNLLDISKIESGKIELNKKEFNVAGVITRTINLFKSKAREKGLELKAEYALKKINLYADTDKINQIFINLVDNAIKFTDKGVIEIFVREKKDEIECVVSDTGIGISKSDLPRVFSKFQQFGRVPGAGEKGTGLGLSIAKGLVEMHKGEIWAESELGKGTKFIFTIPKEKTRARSRSD